MRKVLLLLTFMAFLCFIFFLNPLNTISEENKNEVVVKTVKELLTEISSDKTIYLEPGEYLIEEAYKFENPNIKWPRFYEDEGYDQFGNNQITITDVKNLKLMGKTKDGKVKILCDSRITYVLKFVNCQNIELSNITLGHTGDVVCFAGVLWFDKSKNITVNKCGLNGCGIEGLTLNEIDGFKFSKSKIWGCSNSIMTLKNSNNLNFVNSNFYKNQSSDINILSSSNITFDKCKITGNKENTLRDDTEIYNSEGVKSIFYLNDSKGVSIKNTTIKENKIKNLVYPKDSLKLGEGNKID